MASAIAQSLDSQARPSNVTTSTRKPVTPAASFLLDIVRLGAALLVVVAHFSHGEFNTSTRSYQMLGDVAVPVFFVLSGFVIRYVTLSREHTLRVFFVDRASRVYSVAIPALLLTLFVTVIAEKSSPAYFAHYFADTSTHPLVRIVLNMTLLSQSWGHNTVAFCNSPFWSLSYEGLYYIAYGFFFYLRGTKRILALLLWAAMAGPQVAFLLPIWWMGSWLYDVFQVIRFTWIATAFRILFSVYALAASALYFAGHDTLLFGPLRAVVTFSALSNPLLLIHQSPYRATLMAVATGTLAAVVMLALLLLSDCISISRENPWTRSFRHIADGTFSIYLMHYPLMVLATCLGLYRPGTFVRDVAITGIICILLILIAKPLDVLKEQMRRLLRRAFPTANPVVPASP